MNTTINQCLDGIFSNVYANGLLKITTLFNTHIMVIFDKCYNINRISSLAELLIHFELWYVWLGTGIITSLCFIIGYGLAKSSDKYYSICKSIPNIEENRYPYMYYNIVTTILATLSVITYVVPIIQLLFFLGQSMFLIPLSIVVSFYWCIVKIIENYVISILVILTIVVIMKFVIEKRLKVVKN